MSFAEDQSGGCSPSGGILPEEAEAEATTGYSTDDEAEGGRRLWGAALERARYSPLLAPTRRDEAAQDAALWCGVGMILLLVVVVVVVLVLTVVVLLLLLLLLLTLLLPQVRRGRAAAGGGGAGGAGG